ncbi:MAG TPA: TraR/DksA C4-type zinc finger protein [Vicinamibacterales bacterium]|nr:TraR/DksA C4-type zinc finger protein [Vicinamibacterales bacterium]
MRSSHRTRLRVSQAGSPTIADILEARRHETVKDLEQRVRDARAEWSLVSEIRDTADISEFDGREDLALTLIEMKADTLTRIDEALTRIRNGTYGRCVDCRHSIAERRLDALPFASRCTQCETEREHDAGTDAV